MPNIKQVSKANLICQKILDLQKNLSTLTNRNWSPAAVLAWSSRKKLTVTDLIENAELAMYKAKESGGDCYQTLRHNMRTEASETCRWKEKFAAHWKSRNSHSSYNPKWIWMDVFKALNR